MQTEQFNSAKIYLVDCADIAFVETPKALMTHGKQPRFTVREEMLSNDSGQDELEFFDGRPSRFIGENMAGRFGDGISGNSRTAAYLCAVDLTGPVAADTWQMLRQQILGRYGRYLVGAPQNLAGGGLLLQFDRGLAMELRPGEGEYYQFKWFCAGLWNEPSSMSWPEIQALLDAIFGNPYSSQIQCQS